MGNEMSEFQDLCADLRAGSLIEHIKASYLPSVFHDQHACQLADALLSSSNQKVQRLDFNIAHLTCVGTRALGRAIRKSGNLRHVQLRYTRNTTDTNPFYNYNNNNNNGGSSAVSSRQARQALKVLLEELQLAPSLQELYLVGTDLTIASKEFGQFLQTTKTLKALRASALPLMTAANKIKFLVQGLQHNTSIELVELYELPNSMLDAFLMGLEGHVRLKWLAIDLEGGRVQDTSSLETFLQSPRNKSLEKLVWSRSSNMSLQPILTSLRRNESIKILKIVDSTLTLQDAVQLKLLLRANNNIESLLLSSNHLTNDQFREIALGLYRNLHLRELDLANNGLHGLEASVILRSLLQRNRSIQQLDLSRNQFGGTQGVRWMTQGLARNAGVQELVLSAMQLLDDDMMIFLSGLQVRTTPLKAIALSNNFLGPAGVEHLVHVMERCSVETIVLTGNRRIGTIGARLLAEHLQSPTCRLKVLCLDGTDMGDAGLQALSSALEQNGSLEYLSADEILFSSAGMASLAHSLPNMKKLIRLDFTWNATLPDIPPPYLMEAFRQNTSLVQVDLTGLEVGEWSETLLFYGIRNRYGPLLSGSSSVAPPSLWPLALEKLAKSNIASVAFYCLISKLPWLLENAVDANGPGPRTRTSKTSNLSTRPTTRPLRKRKAQGD